MIVRVDPAASRFPSRQNADRVSRVRFDDDALERLEVGVFAEECGYSRPIGSGHDTPARRVHFALLEAWARRIAGDVTTVNTSCVPVSSPRPAFSRRPLTISPALFSRPSPSFRPLARRVGALRPRYESNVSVNDYEIVTAEIKFKFIVELRPLFGNLCRDPPSLSFGQGSS